MIAALVQDADWRAAVPAARERGAELVCLPAWSFAPYLPARLDREGLERAERPPSPAFREALTLAGGAWLAASAYESEGEGVFYLGGLLAGPGAGPLRHRQRELDAEPGRWEPLLLSPGHEPQPALGTPWGPATVLLGAELRSPAAWERAARAGARLVAGGASEPPDLWARTRRAVAGLAAAHGIAALVANRGGAQDAVAFAGGGIACAADGSQAEPGPDGIVEIEVSA